MEELNKYYFTQYTCLTVFSITQYLHVPRSHVLYIPIIK